MKRNKFSPLTGAKLPQRVSRGSGITCQRCGEGSVWISGMLWECNTGHEFIVDSSRPLGEGHKFIER